MESTQKTSRKRKQSSLSTPFSGILTRQKSQKFFFNRNRSGISRKCRVFQPMPAKVPTPIVVSCDASEGGDEDGDGNCVDVEIKDLRARRVFSKPPKKQNVGKFDDDDDDVFDSQLIDCKVNYCGKGNPNFDLLKNCDLGVSKLCDLGKCDGSGSEANLIAKDLITVDHDLSALSMNCDDYGVNLMDVDVNVENANLVVEPEKCDSVISCRNPNFMLLKKSANVEVNVSGEGLNGGNPNLPVLKKCDSGVSDGNPSLSLLERNDDSRVNSVAEALNGRDLSWSILSDKCESVNTSGISNLMEKCDSGADCAGKVLDNTSPNLSRNILKGGRDEKCVVVNEVSVQTTPPDAVVLIRKSDERNVLKKQSYVSRSLTKQISPSKEMTLNKCSRRKVYKVPNSFTYKRLLPYLMDLAKDEPCVLKANANPKIEMDVEDKPFGSLSQETTFGDPKLPNKPDSTAPRAPLKVSIVRKDEFSMPKSVTSSTDTCQTTSVSSENPMPDGSMNRASQDEHISPDNLTVSLHCPKITPEHSSKDSSLEPFVGTKAECRAMNMGITTEESLISKFHSPTKLAIITNDLLASSTKSGDHGVDSMVEDSDGENPLVALKECGAVTNCGNRTLPVLEKCDSGVSNENRSSSVLERCDDFRVSVVSEGLNGEDLNQSMLSDKCEPVINSGIPIVSDGGNCCDSLEKCESGVDCGGKLSHDISPNLSNYIVESRLGDNCKVVNEETVHTTPPEAVILTRKSDEHSALKSQSSISRSWMKQTSPSKETTLNKCLRRKVFKVPNSFTYKRLLPYLTDMAKDEPCGTLKSNPSVKSEIKAEEKHFGSSSLESTINDLILPDKSPSMEVSIDRKDELSMPRPIISSTDKSLTNLVSSESLIPDDLKERLSQNDHMSPDNRAVTLDSPNTTPEQSNKDASLEPSTGARTEESLISKFHSPTKLAMDFSSGALAAGLTTGILKRNPRGCRGICSCLNCASFRLNAEKSFEFSKNQLLEAEEVAQDLMKELSNLRSMLKKSVAGTTEVETVSFDQVEEACKRASDREVMVKARFSQMHEELYVHCRNKALHRPRVNFYRNVQESVGGQLTN